MLPSREALENALAALAGTAGVEGAAVVARDGMTLAAKLPTDVDADTFGAMSATMVGAASTAAYEFQRRPPEALVLDMDAWRLLAADCGPNAFIVAVADARLDRTAAKVRLHATARHVRALLEGRPPPGALEGPDPLDALGGPLPS